MWPSEHFGKRSTGSLIAVGVVDTGLASGIRNAAMDRACLEREAPWHSKDMLRFFRSRPTASIGRHQALDRELRLEYCRQQEIDIIRRPTSGGALYIDPDQLGFSLILSHPGKWRGLCLEQLLELGSAAVAAGLRELGIAAASKSPNDVEVDGRKIASVFATVQEKVLLLHGNVLLDADIPTMLKTLRVPTEKLSPHGLAAARERLTTVNALRGDWLPVSDIKAALMNGFASTFGLELHAGDEAMLLEPTPGQLAAERDRAQAIVWENERDHKSEALLRPFGGTLRARADFTPLDMRLHGVEFATSAQIEPAGFLAGLERSLKELSFSQIGNHISEFMRQHPLDAVGIGAADIEKVLQQLAGKHRFAQHSGLSVSGINALIPSLPAAEFDCATLLSRASVMLVPYCAKPAWCKWRHLDGCTECGQCEVSTAYTSARNRNMQVTTITNYEHLVSTLGELKARRVQAYIGMCCSNFFIKRSRAFAEAGMPALLMDISGANCYELQQEAQAYAGTFAAQANLNEELLAHIMNFVPSQPKSSCNTENHETARFS